MCFNAVAIRWPANQRNTLQVHFLHSKVLAEFNAGMEVYLCKPNNDIVRTTIAKLLPLSFTPDWVTFST